MNAIALHLIYDVDGVYDEKCFLFQPQDITLFSIIIPEIFGFAKFGKDYNFTSWHDFLLNYVDNDEFFKTEVPLEEAEKADYLVQVEILKDFVGLIVHDVELIADVLKIEFANNVFSIQVLDGAPFVSLLLLSCLPSLLPLSFWQEQDLTTEG